MINVILNGACGRLGTTFQKVITDAADIKIVAGVDVNRTGISTDFPLYKTLKTLPFPRTQWSIFQRRQHFPTCSNIASEIT